MMRVYAGEGGDRYNWPMVDIAAPLKPYQVEVLRWVEAGCHDAGMPGDGAKQTARALQGRRLVTVSRRNGRWSAALTERGRYYLDNGRYPELTGTTSRDLAESSSTPVASGGKGQQPTAQPAVIQEATALIERLQTSGGTVVVSDPDADTRATYRRAIHAAKQHRLVPDGYDLRHTGRNTGDLVVRLYSAAQPYDTDWNRLRLDQGDNRATAAADYGALEQDPTDLRVAPESIPRVLAALRAINDAGVTRKCRVGINVTTKKPKPYVKFGSARRSLEFFEEYEQVPHVLTADERRTNGSAPGHTSPSSTAFPPAGSGSKSARPHPASASPGVTPRPGAWNSRPVASSPTSSKPSKSRNGSRLPSGSERRNGRPQRDSPNSRLPRSAAAVTSNARQGGSTPSRKPAAVPSRSTAGRHSTPRWTSGRKPQTCGRFATPSSRPPLVGRRGKASSPPGWPGHAPAPTKSTPQSVHRHSPMRTSPSNPAQKIYAPT